MKYKSTLIVLLFLIVAPIKAQSYKQVGWISKFGAAAGFTPVLVFPKVDQINMQLNSLGLNSFSNKGLITYGGSGYIYLMAINNFRIGGYGFGGSFTEAGKLNSYDTEVEYHYGSGGVTLEYTIPSIKKVALSVGLMIGGGTQEIEIYSNKGSFDWGAIWQNTSNPASESNYHRTLKNNFVTFAPIVNLDVPFNRFMAIRVGGGYIFSFGNSWEVDNENKIDNFPDTLNGDAFFIQAGLFFGFFAF